jgi:hypothetical protein
MSLLLRFMVQRKQSKIFFTHKVFTTRRLPLFNSVPTCWHSRISDLLTPKQTWHCQFGLYPWPLTEEFLNDFSRKIVLGWIYLLFLGLRGCIFRVQPTLTVLVVGLNPFLHLSKHLTKSQNLLINLDFGSSMFLMKEFAGYIQTVYAVCSVPSTPCTLELRYYQHHWLLSMVCYHIKR